MGSALLDPGLRVRQFPERVEFCRNSAEWGAENSFPDSCRGYEALVLCTPFSLSHGAQAWVSAFLGGTQFLHLENGNQGVYELWLKALLHSGISAIS